MQPSVFRIQGRPVSHGFARVGVATFWCKPMGVTHNLEACLRLAQRAHDEGLQVCGFPELTLTGYGVRNGFRQRELQLAALNGLRKFCAETGNLDPIFVIGLPLRLNDLFNVAAVVHHGKVLAFVPKSFLAARSEWQENEWFAPASRLPCTDVDLPWQADPVPIGTDILIEVLNEDETTACTLGIEICADGWQANSPGDRHAHNGANVILNLSASNFVLGKDAWRETLFAGNSGRQKSAYLYVTMSGDSTSSVVWDGHCFIVEDGTFLARSQRWTTPDTEQLICADVDVEKLEHDRACDGEWAEAQRLNMHPYRHITVKQGCWVGNSYPHQPDLRRPLTRLPFVPKGEEAMKRVGDEMLEALAQGFMGRLLHVGRGKPMDVFMGYSGGRDSGYAACVCVYGFDKYGWPRRYFNALRMPGPASSNETQDLSLELAQKFGFTIRTAEIETLATEALRLAGHEPCWKCLQCENAQARARTYVAKTCGFNVGTGDLSESAKGWCTEGGDQSSHWHAIANVPKTLVEYGIRHYLTYKTDDPTIKRLLQQMLDSTISPELIKVGPGEKIQDSEASMGPYDLTDFFLYHFLRTGATPERIAFLAEIAFSRKERERDQIYDRATILKWLRDFYVKFNIAQYKRNASPDSVLIGSVGLGAHDKFRWPSDGDMSVFVEEVDELIAQL